MEEFLIKALQLILCFALLILLHEGGHFFFAKIFKVRVEKFCLFFDPWKSWKLFTWHGTAYHIGWIPLGGYVKISGMIDESMDTEQIKQPIKPWEFRAKPAWQRLLIMVGGVLVNFLLALFIYAMILFAWGDTYFPIDKMEHGFKYNEQALRLGFRNGDIPLSADGKTFERFDADLLRDISEANNVIVLRQGRDTVALSLPGDLDLLQMLKADPPFIAPLAPSLIDSVKAGSPAERAGIRAGDRLLALNGAALDTWNDFDERMADLNSSLTTYCEDGNRTMADSLARVSIVVRHSHSADADTLNLVLDADGMMGIYKHHPYDDYPITTRHYTFFSSFPAGIGHGWEVLCGYVNDLKYVFTADGAKSVGSFGTIGNLFPAQWDWLRFWELTAFISLMLAFMNILPIPALDGGHVLFLLYEVVTRRKPSDKFMEYAQTAGMWILFALMAYAIFNDLLRFVF